MRLAVNPNRMELLRLRRRLVLAERGHKLLKDKLEEIMRRFLQLMRRLFELQERIGPKLKKAFLSFAFVRARSSQKDLERLIPEGKLLLAPKKERIFNVSIPQFEIGEKEISEYDFVNKRGFFRNACVSFGRVKSRFLPFDANASTFVKQLERKERFCLVAQKWHGRL